MAWKLKIFFSDGDEEVVDEMYDSEEAAEAGYDYYLESYSSGAGVLELMDEETGASIIDYEVWEE